MIDVFIIIAQIIIVLCFIIGISKPLVMAFCAIAAIPLQNDSIVSYLRVNELAMILWIIIFIAYFFRYHTVYIDKMTKLLLLALVFLFIWSVISYSYWGFSSTFQEYVRLAVAILFPISLYNTFKKEYKKFYIGILSTWSLTAAVLVMVSVVNLSFRGTSLLQYLQISSSDVYSFYTMKFLASPFLQDPNNYGGYLIISIGITYYLYTINKKRMYMIMTIIQLVGLFTSLSRGAYVAFVLTVLIVLYLNKRSKAIASFLILAVVGVGIVTAIPLISRDASAYSRFGIWATAIMMFIDHPIFGVGLGNFTNLFSRYVSKYVTIYNPYTHNLFLKILTETGLVGLIFFICVFVYGIKQCNKSSATNSFKNMFLFGTIAFLIQGMTVEFFSSNYFWTFFLLSYYAIKSKAFPHAQFSPKIG